MDILNMVFTGLFTVEMLLKLLALRLRVSKTNAPPNMETITDMSSCDICVQTRCEVETLGPGFLDVLCCDVTACLHQRL